MEEESTVGSRNRWALRLWVTAGLIAFLTLLTELLPVVFGKGEAAGWDWGFWYVTSRYIALPAACAAHLLATAVVFWMLLRESSTKNAWVAVTSAIIPVCEFAAMYLYPAHWLI